LIVRNPVSTACTPAEIKIEKKIWKKDEIGNFKFPFCEIFNENIKNGSLQYYSKIK